MVVIGPTQLLPTDFQHSQTTCSLHYTNPHFALGATSLKKQYLRQSKIIQNGTLRKLTFSRPPAKLFALG